jgi:fibronectin-binding autotransporter adhesin
MNRSGFLRPRHTATAAALLGTALTALTALTATPAFAQDSTWNGANGDFGTNSNWTPATVPTNRATFANTGQNNVTITANTTLSQIVFAPNAQFYSITNLGTLILTGGISNTSNLPETFINNGGTINFMGTALVQSATGSVSINNLLGNVNFTGQSGTGDNTTLVTTSAVVLASGGATVVPTGTSSTSFVGSSFADDAGLSTIGGTSQATDAGSNATGGNASLSFADDSHADRATFVVGNGPGVANASVAGGGGTATATGGNGTLTFSDNSHADDAVFVNFNGPANAAGGAGAAGGPGTGAVGTATVAQGGFGLTIFNDNSHADRSNISNVGGAGATLGGTGGAGGTTAGGAGGAATSNAGIATFVLNGNSHADGATITNRADVNIATGGTGGAGGSAGAGGVGGNARSSSGGTNFVLNDNAHVSGATIVNRGGTALANGGIGGAGSGITAGINGGAGGNAISVGDTVTFTLNGNATLGTGTTIDNRGGDATAIGGRGGAGNLGAGGRGGNGNATGGNAALVFNDHSSAGDAVIINRNGAVTGNGGNGGNGGTAAGGNGGSGAAVGGQATIDFNGNATAGSATITNTIAVGVSAIAAGTNGTGATGGTGGGASTVQTGPVIRFNDNATGGSVHIVNTVGAVFFNDNSVFGTAAPGGPLALLENAAGAFVGFNDSASLGNGGIVNNGAVGFFDNSSAGTGTILNNGGAIVSFQSSSDAVAGSIVNAGGTVDVSVNAFRLGSLTGTGTVNILSTSLQVGYLDRNETFAGVIAGAGDLLKRGTGTWTLTGANTYTGTTFVTAGVLQIGNGGTTGSVAGNIDVAAAAAVTFNRSDNVSFGNIVSGAGSLTKAGTGVLVLTNTNTYTGGTLVSAGTLQIGNAGTTGSIVGNVSVAAGAALVFNRTDAISFAGGIAGTGQLTKLAAGTLTLTGNVTLTGNTIVSQGVLQIGNGGTAGSITGNIINNANVTFNRSDTITYGGVMSGAGGSLTKIGAGTLILTAANTYTGATLVNAGTLQLMGSITSPTTVGAAGTLRGTGTINGGLGVNGILNPGTAATPLGTLTVTGNATFGAGSFLTPTINSVGGSSLLQAGTLTINGGQVRPTAQTGGLFLMQTDFRIAVGAAGRTGSFTGVDESQLPSFLDASLFYTATEAFLRVRRNATTFAQTTGLTPNQAAVGGALDAAVAANNPVVFTTYLTTYNTLLALTGSQLQGALNVLSGDALTAFPVAAQEHANRFAGRLNAYTWSNSSNLWGLIAYGDQSADSDGNGPGFSANGVEFQLGFNTSLGHNTRLGLSAGMNNGDVSVDDRLTTGNVDTWSLGAQLRHDFGQVYVSGQLTYSWHSIDSSRPLLVGGTATADYDAKTWTAAGEIGWVIQSGQLSIEPHLSVRHADTSTDAYSETGPAGAVNVAAADYRTTRLGIGLRLANRTPDAPVKIYALARYEHETGDEQSALDNTLPGLPTFRVVGTRLGDDILSGEVGAEFRLSNGFSLFVAGGGHTRSNETSLQADGGLRVRF